ncbi:hypothetical protein RN001_002016 [Aquatica leii]|uniref:Uncharacterized protein n=1 Tax=Aquatica leii TaxID=1421715 RepID=A0AAN7PCS0_9COLE|nr:hypothetical protein RN001_002016 [Aquatica leii]
MSNFTGREQAMMERALSQKFNYYQPTKRIKPYRAKNNRAVQPPEEVVELNSKNKNNNLSPEMVITSEDLRVFENEVYGSYGLSSTEINSTEKQLRRERNRLLSEVRLPLNNSESKYVCVGLDPFRGFQPVVRIIKASVGMGVTLTRHSYEELALSLDSILAGLKNDSLSDACFGDYTVTLISGYDMCKFVPKNMSNDNFELYIMRQSLETLFTMREFILEKLNVISMYNLNFESFCNDVVGYLGDDYEDENDTIKFILRSKYSKNYLLHELYYKFNHFVIDEIRKVVNLR